MRPRSMHPSVRPERGIARSARSARGRSRVEGRGPRRQRPSTRGRESRSLRSHDSRPLAQGERSRVGSPGARASANFSPGDAALSRPEAKKAPPTAEEPARKGGEDDLHDVIERLDRVLTGESFASPLEIAQGRGSTPGRALPNDLMERWRHLCDTSALLNSVKNEFDPILETVVDIAIELTR